MPRKPSKKTLIILGVIFCAILCYLWLRPSATPEEPPIKEVETETVALHSIAAVEEFIGTIQSKHSTTLLAKKKGILDQVATSGQPIQKGQLLAKILNPDVERNYTLSEKAEQIAKLQYERAEQLFNSGVSSKNAIEEQMKSWIDTQKNLAAAKIALDEITIEAPFDGVVGLFKVHEGSQVSEGDALVVVYDPSSLMVEFDMPLETARVAQTGNPVWIDGRHYPLMHLQKMLDQESHMCPASVDIECATCILGSTVSVQVVIEQKESVLTIPYEAIFLRDGHPHVYRVKEGQAALTSIDLGIREKERVEVTQGLQEGDAVIISGQGRLYPGIPVHIYTAPPSSPTEST